MNIGLYDGVAGMRMNQSYQDMIAENLALGSTPGYKQTFPVFSTETNAPGKLDNVNEAAQIKLTRMVDFSQGPMEPSGSPFHLAIQGESFFTVRDPNGSTSYTRNGEFGLSAQGQLMTTDGAAVMGQGGAPISIDPTQAAAASSATIGVDGTITVGGVNVGKVGLAHFANPTQDLQPAAYGRFTVSNPNLAQDGPAQGDKVFQGKLELGNGSPVEQMSNMIQAMRLYEANQKVLTANDDNQGQLISTLGGRS